MSSVQGIPRFCAACYIGTKCWKRYVSLMEVAVLAVGPRCHTMKAGSRRRALDTLMDLSDVVLMTLVGCMAWGYGGGSRPCRMA